MGLSGSGKSSLALEIYRQLPNAMWLNADHIRTEFHDWDFSIEGRIRQAKRIRQLADDSGVCYVIADFIAPLPEQRDIFEPDILIYMNTITTSEFADTNKMFQAPLDYSVKFDDFEQINVDLVLAMITEKAQVQLFERPSYEVLHRQFS
jgi:adenylylsulfate kinase